MNFKNKQNQSFFMAGILLMLIITSVGFYISRPQNVATAHAELQPPYLGKPANTPTPQPSNEVLSQTVNDVTVRITYTKIIETGVEIGICYTTLDGGEWYPVPGHLYYSSYDILPDEYGFTTEEKASNKKTGERCAFVRYRIDELDSITAPIQISLLQVRAIPRELPACENFQERIESNSKAKSYGLITKCTENSDGSINIEVVEHGKSIDKEKAKNIVDEIALGIVEGPWEFTITEIEK
jgi:hypothetical protein